MQIVSHSQQLGIKGGKKRLKDVMLNKEENWVLWSKSLLHHNSNNQTTIRHLRQSDPCDLIIPAFPCHGVSEKVDKYWEDLFLKDDI